MGLRLAWACRRTRRDLKVDHRAVRKFVDSELSLKKSWRPASTIAPNIATRRVQRRKYQDHIKPERPGFIDETWTVIADNPGSCKAMRQLIRVAGVKLFFLPKICAGPAPDRADIRQHLLRKALHTSSKRSAPQVLKSSVHLPQANAQIISKFFRPCVNLIAVMHRDVVRARSILKRCVRATHSGKTKAFQCREPSFNCALKSAR
jgi:hypothetical protein